ncbi:DUF5134 domain-containing protein [Pseudonocardia spinosispora]|uniref:DUF5134 domain-containing protein n=1 Tax=Pseudonocardia spinosispora TaxID=103441 RepID=UPI00040C07A1|nr:DUF5134 domain-containing protein [Pseudonocardia spinosispora]
MIGTLLLVALLVGAAISAWRLLHRDRRPAELAYLTSPESDAAHVVMNLTMAAMLLPGYGASWRVPLLVVLGATAVALLVLLGVRIALPGPGAGSLVYHLLASAAMIYAVVIMPDMSMGSMGSMHHMASTGVTLTAMALAALFALDAVLTAGIVVFAPRTALAVAGGGAVDGGGATTLRIAAVPHLAMDVAMVVMLAAL